MVILQFAGVVDRQSPMLNQVESGPIGGGFYTGPIPDFSVTPVSGNVFEYIDTEWSLINREDEHIPFSSFEGKVLFINRWATWCAPCIAEMPDIAELEAELNTGDVVFLLISDEQESIVDAFQNEHNLPLYVSRGRVPIILNGRGLPSSIIVDKEGVIRYQHKGPAEWSHPSVVNFLSALAG